MVRAPVSGRVWFATSPDDLPGRYLRTGTMVAVVAEQANTTVKALIDQPTLARLRLQSIGETSVAVATGDGALLHSRLRPATPAAVRALPDPGFARALGGTIEADGESM